MYTLMIVLYLCFSYQFCLKKKYLWHLLLQVKFFFSSLSIYMHINFLKRASVSPNLKQSRNAVFAKLFLQK